MRVISQIKTLDARGTPGRFLGFAPDSVGYLLWDERSRTIRNRRGVKFHFHSDDTGGPDKTDYSVYMPVLDVNMDVEGNNDLLRNVDVATPSGAELLGKSIRRT